MNWRMVTALILAVCLAPAAQASHFQAYANNPDSHDDLGSSSEPDFRGVTSLLGVPVTERVVDVTLDGRGEVSSSFPAGRALAPGCTDDSGRQPHGLCGIFTIGAQNGEGTESGLGFPPRTVGTEGMGGTAAPGLTASKGTTVRLLDQKAVSDYNLPGMGTQFMDLNRKIADSGAGNLLRSVDPNFGSQALFYSMAHFAWYGKWQDKNGNGVIDSLQYGINPANGEPVESPFNEFVWYGNCLDFDTGNPHPGWHCTQESASAPGGTVEMSAYIYPGNHHAYCGVILGGPNGAANACDKVGIDLPGGNLLCFADAVSAPVLQVVTATTARCFTPQMEDIDPNEAEFEGDPIFGVQNSPAPDQTFDDRSGDPGFDTRGWYFGLGWPTFYYDQSLVTSTTIITVVNCVKSIQVQRYDLNSCAFVDVDRYPTWSPALENLVGGLKPTARSNFVFVRDTYTPFGNGVDGQVNNKRADLSLTTGPVNDQYDDPGFGREPNAPGDVYPGAVRGACADGDATHNGWCNSYAGYRTGGGRGWADVQAFRSITYDRAITIEGVAGCVTCVSGPGLSLSDSPENLRQPGDHNRSLGPGGYFFAGASGRWLDRNQAWTETYYDLDPASTTFGQLIDRDIVRGPDGWVGNVVNATGTFYYRGYGDEACTTENGPGTYTYAVCHPYLDGVISDPQQAGTRTHGEWEPGCDSVSLGNNQLEIRPAGGVWTVPVFVLRDHGSLRLPADLVQGDFEDYTGRGSIFTALSCFPDSGGFLSADFVVLPAGNLGQDVTTRLVQRIPQAPPNVGFDTVVDVDNYVRYG